jgi:hypothetical protein
LGRILRDDVLYSDAQSWFARTGVIEGRTIAPPAVRLLVRTPSAGAMGDVSSGDRDGGEGAVTSERARR